MFIFYAFLSLNHICLAKPHLTQTHSLFSTYTHIVYFMFGEKDKNYLNFSLSKSQTYLCAACRSDSISLVQPSSYPLEQLCHNVCQTSSIFFPILSWWPCFLLHWKKKIEPMRTSTSSHPIYHFARSTCYLPTCTCGSEATLSTCVLNTLLSHLFKNLTPQLSLIFHSPLNHGYWHTLYIDNSHYKNYFHNLAFIYISYLFALL